MHKLVLFCKSYAGDLELVKVLVDSYLRFNKENIPFYISIPRGDVDLFNKHFFDKPVYLLSDEDISNNLVTETNGWFTPGYVNQEIVKLSFWETKIAKNYFCVDSDSYFIKDFFYRDFMFDEETPYSVLIEDKELCVDPLYFNSYWSSRLESLNEIKSRIGLTDSRLVTCHNNTTLSSKVLESFRNEFMLVNKFNYIDLLKISPFEFSWYNFWLQKMRPIQIVPIEPLFKMFHLKEHYFQYCERNITEKDIARAYIGICMNSNWAKDDHIYIYNRSKNVQKINMSHLKEFIKTNMPVFFRLTRRVFQSIRSLFQHAPGPNELQIGEAYEDFLERTLYFRNSQLMKDGFNNSYIVHNGPFKGMKYIDKSSGSAFLPKILGSYEEPIQKWVDHIISEKKYKTILDIGCAEGYYAVGFALNMPESEIIAFDLNPEARNKVEIMININNVVNVKVKDNCSFDELQLNSKKGTLVFCDIEGAEEILLDPERVPNLLKVDILVESHDCIVPGITELLINRFYKTHVIETVIDYPTRVNNYHLPNVVNEDDYKEIINEHRAEGMKFIYMKSLS